MDALRPSQMRGAYQEDQATEPQDEAGYDPGSGIETGGTKPIEKHHPEGDQSHEQGSHSGGDRTLGQTNSAIADKKQEETGDDSGAPLTSCWPNPGFPAQYGIKDKSGDQVSRSRKQERGE